MEPQSARISYKQRQRPPSRYITQRAKWQVTSKEVQRKWKWLVKTFRCKHAKQTYKHQNQAPVIVINPHGNFLLPCFLLISFVMTLLTPLMELNGFIGNWREWWDSHVILIHVCYEMFQPVVYCYYGDSNYERPCTSSSMQLQSV